jgi:hypothetical protein
MLQTARSPRTCCEQPSKKNAVSAPKLSAWLEDNLAEGFAVFDFPLEHRRSIRTTNSLERINKEIRRRTKVVVVFQTEASCLRLVSAILMEISEEWQIGKHYCAGKLLNFKRPVGISDSNLQKKVVKSCDNLYRRFFLHHLSFFLVLYYFCKTITTWVYISLIPKW